MSLLDDLAALRAHGVTVADFVDGKLTHVEMGPAPMPAIPDEDVDQRGVMVLPGNPRGGPATAPSAVAMKPRDLMRDLILADLAAPPELTAEDLPEEPDDGDALPESDETRATETRDDIGDGGLSGSGADETQGGRSESH
jgi:hypothetical protein